MSRPRNNFRKQQPGQRASDSPQRITEVENILSNLHNKLHSLENKYGDFVTYCADVLKENRSRLDQRLYTSSFVEETNESAIDVYDELQEERKKLEEDLNYVLTVKEELGSSLSENTLMDTNSFAPISEALSLAQNKILLQVELEESQEDSRTSVIDIFSTLSNSIWNVLLKQGPGGHSDSLSKIAKLENDVDAGRMEANKRQILKLSKENGLLRETINELNEQINLLHEKIMDRDDTSTTKLVQLLDDRSKENSNYKSELKKASDSVKSLQQKLAQSTTHVLNKDSEIHKKDFAYLQLKAQMELMEKTHKSKIAYFESEQKQKRRALSSAAKPNLEVTKIRPNRAAYLSRDSISRKKYEPVRSEQSSPTKSGSLNNTLKDLKTLKRKLQQTTKERDYFKSCSENINPDEKGSYLLQTQIQTLIEITDPILNDEEINLGQTQTQLRGFLEEYGTDKFAKSVYTMENETKILEVQLDEERKRADTFYEALEIKQKQIKSMKSNTVHRRANSEMTKLKEKYDTLKESNVKLSETITQLQQRSPQTNKDDLLKLQGDLSDLSQMLTLKNEKYKLKSEKYKQLREKCATQEDTKALCGEEIAKYADNIEQQFEELARQVAEKEYQLGSLTTQIQGKLEEHLKKLEGISQDSTTKEQLNEAFSELDLKETELQTLRDQIDSMKEAEEHTSIKTNQASFEIKQLSYEKQTLDEIAKELRENLSSEEARRLELERELCSKLNEANDRIERLVFENSQFKNSPKKPSEDPELTEMKEQLAAKETEKEKLEKHRDDLSLQLGEEISAKMRAIQKNNKVEAEAKQLQNQVSSMQGALANYEQVLQSYEKLQKDKQDLETRLNKASAGPAKSSPGDQRVIDDLKDQVEIAQDTIKQLREALKKNQIGMEAEKKEVKNKLKSLRAEHENMLFEKQELADLKETLSKKCEKSKAKSAKLKEDLKEVQSRITEPTTPVKKDSPVKAESPVKVEPPVVREDPSVPSEEALKNKRELEELIIETAKLRYETDDISTRTKQMAEKLEMPNEPIAEVLTALDTIVDKFKKLQIENDVLNMRENPEKETGKEESELKAKLESEIDEREEELQVLHQTNQQLIEKYNKQTSELQDITEEYGILDINYQQVDTDLQIVRKEKEIQDSQISQMEEDMKRLSEEKKTTTKHLQELSDAMQSIEDETKDQMSDLRIEVYEERKLGEQYKEEIAKLTEELGVAQKAVATGNAPEGTEKMIQDLQKTIENHTLAAKELKNKLATKDTLINTLHEENKALNTGSAPQGVPELRERIFELETDLASTLDQLDELTRQNKTNEDKVRVLTDVNDATKAKLKVTENLRRQLTDCKAELEQAKKKYDNDMMTEHTNYDALKRQFEDLSSSNRSDFVSQVRGIPSDLDIVKKFLHEGKVWCLGKSKGDTYAAKEEDLISAGHMVPELPTEDPILSEVRHMLNLNATDSILDALSNIVDPNFDSKSSSIISGMDVAEESPKVSSVDSDPKRAGNEQTYKLLRVIRTLKSENEDAQNNASLLQEQIKVLKDEIVDQQRQLSRSQHDSPENTNIESFKDMLTKFIVFLPLSLPKEAENLIRIIYSMLYLSQVEITTIENQRKEFNTSKGKKKKSMFGIFGK